MGVSPSSESAGCTVGLGRWGGGKNPANPSEDLANNALLASYSRAAYTPVAGRVVAGSAEAEGVGHGRKEGADTNVPAWLINRAQYSITGTNFPG
jgi:hypothetical protein